MGGEGAPGRRHPALHQSCTRLKLSRAAGGLDMCFIPMNVYNEMFNGIRVFVSSDGSTFRL